MALTAAFEAEVAKTRFKVNNVIEVVLDGGSEFYSMHPISGFSAIKDYIIGDINEKAQKISVKRASSSYGSMPISLLDKSNEITASMATESWSNKKIIVYAFYDGLTWPTDRATIFTGRLTSAKSKANLWNIIVQEEGGFISKTLYDQESALTAAINDSVTSIPVESASNYDSTGGFVAINSEFISYSGVDTVSEDLTGAVRGVEGSTAASHSLGDSVHQLVKLSGDPITLMLQILLSVDGDGANNATYDVISEGGVGLATADVDVSTFETIRDSNSFGTYTFHIKEGMADAVKFLETEILTPTNTRLINTFEGQISLALLTKLVFGATTKQIDNDSIVGDTTLKIDQKQIINKLKISSNYDAVTNKFRTIKEFEDATSIGLYGESSRSKKSFSFKGIPTDALVTTFANNYFLRNSTPAPEITFKSFLKNRVLAPGDKIELEVKNTPNLSLGNRAFNDQMEVQSIALKGDLITIKASRTNFQTGRLAYIAPAKVIASKSSETVFDVASGTGSCFQVGWKMTLYNSTTGARDSTFRTITDITTDTITIDTAFDVTISTSGNHYIRFADFNDVVESQKLYAFIGDSSDQLFDDGSDSYVIQD
jgi:hypothetical protein